MRAFSILTLAVFTGTVSGRAPEPDFVVTAEEFSKELMENPKGAQKKYLGKVIQVRGTVWKTRIDDSVILFHGHKARPTDTYGLFGIRMPDKKLKQQLRMLSSGQNVTVQATMKNGYLGDCTFVTIGRSLAQGVTLDGLTAELGKRDAVRQYFDRPLAMKVRILEVKKDVNQVIWTATDAGGKGKAKMTITTQFAWDKDVLSEFESVKVGDEIYLLASVLTQKTLWGAVIISELPKGVTLPNK